MAFRHSAYVVINITSCSWCTMVSSKFSALLTTRLWDKSLVAATACVINRQWPPCVTNVLPTCSSKQRLIHLFNCIWFVFCNFHLKHTPIIHWWAVCGSCDSCSVIGWEGWGVVGNVDRYEYYWCDGVNYKRPTKLPATQYIELLMEWVEAQINNEELFPIAVGTMHDDSCLHLRCVDVAFYCRRPILTYIDDISYCLKWLQWHNAVGRGVHIDAVGGPWLVSQTREILVELWPSRWINWDS